MSAFIVTDNHIHALVGYAIRHDVSYRVNGNRVAITENNADEIGQILVDENYRSVHQRYAERTKGYFGDAESGYKFKRQPLPDAVTMIKAVHCFEYQACETDDWEKSIAHSICEAIIDAAIRKLPGYDAAPWGIR